MAQHPNPMRGTGRPVQIVIVVVIVLSPEVLSCTAAT
jgi:hypothetical protein